jgi:hypothetical protein
VNPTKEDGPTPKPEIITIHAMLGFDPANDVPDATPNELMATAEWFGLAMSDKDLGPFPDDLFRPGWRWRRIEVVVEADSSMADSAINNSARQRGLGCPTKTAVDRQLRVQR